MRIGRVTGRQVAKNRDGDTNTLLLTVEISEPDDLQTVELITQAGEDYNPPDDSNIVVIDLGEAWKVAIACDDGIEPDADVGERILYSIAAGIRAAVIALRENGDIELNINAVEDFAVRYNKLAEAFNQLKSDYDSHTHQYLPGPGTAIPSGPPVPTTTADITPAKIDNIKVPGVV
jgi:hypothetical protein